MPVPTRQELIEQAQKARQKKVTKPLKPVKDEEEQPEPDALTRLQQNRIPKPDKQQQPIKKRGEKLKELFKGYKKLVKIFLSRPENFRCQIQSPVCQGLATCVHHVAGRTGEKLKDQKDWMPACDHCNDYVEQQDSWAREKGFKKTRLGKVKK